MKLSVQQKNLIGQIIPNIPKYKVTLWESYNDDSVKSFRDFKTNEEKNSITPVLGIWCAYVGYKAEPNELVMINQFVRKSFSQLNIEDLKEAIEMVGDGRIKVDYHGNFAPLYVGKCLAVFKRIRGEIFYDIRNAISEHNKLLPTPKPSAEESLILMKQILKDAHNEAIKGIFTDGGSLVYDHLVKLKLIDFSEKGVRDAQAYAKRRLGMSRKKTVYHAVVKNIPISKMDDKKLKIKNLMREYAVNVWLRSQSYKDMRLHLESLKTE